MKDPLETAIISSEENDNYVRTKLFFTSEQMQSGRVRAFAHIVYDKRWSDNRAAVLIVPSLYENIDYSELSKKLLKEGYVVCIVDYSGSFSDNVNRTTFPKEYSFASIENCKKVLYSISTNARNTPWYIWTKIIRRAISVLQEHRLVNKERIGLIGFGTGAQIAWQTAGIDGRVRALMAVNGGGFLWRKGVSKFTNSNVPSNDEERAFSTGVGAETYARFVTCPTCLIASTNSRAFDVDRAEDIMNLVPAKAKLLIIDKGTDNQITITSFVSALAWLRNNFAIDGNAYPTPKISFENLEGKLYLRLFTEIKAENKKLYYCIGETDAELRYWKLLSDAQKVGAHEYIYAVPVEDSNDLIVAFATMTYSENQVVSTPVVGVFPHKIGINIKAQTTDRFPHIIYPTTSGLETFLISTNEILLNEDLLHETEGPFGIVGVTADKGNLTVLRNSEELLQLKSDTTFKFDAYSKNQKELKIVLCSKHDKLLYQTIVELDGGEFWQKVLLQSTDFKAENGKSLANFSEIKTCIFNDCAGIVFTNLLWI